MEENQLVLIIIAVVFLPYIVWHVVSVLKSIVVDGIYGAKNQTRLSLQDIQKIQAVSQVPRAQFENKLTYRQVKRLLTKSADVLPKNLRLRLYMYQLELMQCFLTWPLTLAVLLFCKPYYALFIGCFMYVFFVMISKKAPRSLYSAISLLPLMFFLILYVCFRVVPDNFKETEDFILIAKGYTCICMLLYSVLAWYAYKKYNSMTKEEYDEIQKILQKIEGGEI